MQWLSTKCLLYSTWISPQFCFHCVFFKGAKSFQVRSNKKQNQNHKDMPCLKVILNNNIFNEIHLSLIFTSGVDKILTFEKVQR